MKFVRTLIAYLLIVSSLSAATITLPNSAALSSARPGDGDVVVLLGGTAIGDTGARTYRYSASSVATVSSPRVIAGPGGIGRYLLIGNDRIETVGTVADMLAIVAPADGQLYQTREYNSGTGVGGNLYRYSVSEPSTPDGLFIMPGVSGTLSFSGATFTGTAGTGRYVAVDQDEADVTKAGAIGDGSTDDTSPLQRAIAASAGKYALVPKGTFVHSGLLLNSYAAIHGVSRDSSILKYSGTGTSIQSQETGITHGVHLSDLTIKGTDGSGGTGLHINTFRRCIFENVTIDMFRNAGDTGKGITFDNQYSNCAFNQFVNLEISNCDDAMVMDGSNASYSVGYSVFTNLRILTEVRGIRMLNSVPDASKYNSFYGLLFQNSGSTTHCLEIEGSGNIFDGVVIDVSPLTTVISFIKTTTSGNFVRFLTGFDSTKYTNNWTSGTPNTLVSGASNVGSPGKPQTITDIIGALDFRLQSGGTNQAVELQIGNSSSSQQWRLVQQASASPYLTLQRGSTLSQRWDRSGNIGIGGTSISAGGGSGVVYLANAITVPTTNPSGGGVLYVESGQLKYREPNGTVTTIAPSALSDGDKGDITVSGSGATWTVDNNVITYAKMQDISATSRIIGRATAGAGDAEELTATQVRTIINVENGADVTDSVNVDAAGAVMNSDTSTASMSFVIDEDSFASNSATKVPSQQSTKAYVDAAVASASGHPIGMLVPADGATSITVTDKNYVQFQNTGATSVTAFATGNVAGHTITVTSTNGNTTIVDSTNIQCEGNANLVLAANDHAEFIWDGAVWWQCGSNVAH